MPNAKIGQVVELVNKLSILGGQSDREGLAYALGINKNSIGHPLKAAELVGLISLTSGEVKLTDIGNQFAQGDEESKRKLFEETLSAVEPFATILRAFRDRKGLNSAEVLNFVKAKIPAARKWRPSTDKEILKMIVNWFDYVGIRFTEQPAEMNQRH